MHACISFLAQTRNSYFTNSETYQQSVKESILYISSYTDANFKMNVRYRKYSSDLPEYLRNRPRELVKHCLKKISLANSAFSVKSFENNESKRYMVSFGDDVNMQKSTCLDWESSCYPRKHFFAVFRKFHDVY